MEPVYPYSSSIIEFLLFRYWVDEKMKNERYDQSALYKLCKNLILTVEQSTS